MGALSFFKQSSLWRDYAFAGFSGMLLWFSWPNALWPGFSSLPGWLALIALVPYFSLWRKTGWRGNFVYGWVVGFIYFLGIIYWLRLINKDTNVDNTIGWIFFAACGGIYFGLFGASARLLRDRLQLPHWLVLPIVWTAWEYVRGQILTGGWPWGSLGHSQYANPLLRQVAAVAGVGGVSFMLVWINYFVLLGIDRLNNSVRHREPDFSSMYFSKKRIQAALFRKPLHLILGAVIILVWSGLLGMLVIETVRFVRVKPQALTIAMVQGNINTDQRWDASYKDKVMTKMESLHAQAAQGKPDLIIWAESCFPSFLEYTPEKKWEDRLRALIRQHQIPTVLTSNEYQKTYLLEGPKYHHYNSAFLLGPQGEVLGRYRKIKLVPGGEYIPWEWMKSFMQAVVREPIPVDFEPGTEYTVFQWESSKFSTLICYEDQYEVLATRMARKGADFFISLSNDGWAGKSAMSTQRVAMSVFLAIENRAYFVKAGMTGPSMLIDPWGRLGKPIPLFEPGINPVVIYPRTFLTSYACFGHLFSFACFILMSAFFLAAFLPVRVRGKVA
ncbi:apolipoprotein N-acyltransferase [bacterium]|nr:apolipoprotein N-acyltransferase [bacterium]